MNQVFIPRSVERSANDEVFDRRPLVVAVLYTLASAFGGASTGTVFGLAGAQLDARDVRTAMGALLTAFVAYTAWLQVRNRIRPLPERHRQVPRGWLLWRRRSVVAVAYGVMIGAGVLTKIRHATFYVVLCFLVLSPSPGASIALGTLYGLTRGGMLLANWAFQARIGSDAVGTGITLEIPRTATVLAVATGAFPLWVLISYYS